VAEALEATLRKAQPPFYHEIIFSFGYVILVSSGIVLNILMEIGAFERISTVST